MGQYNRLGQRRASGAWQWLIIGFFPGLLCGGLVVFLLLFAGVLNSFNSEPEQIEITSAPIRIVVTATTDPLATQLVQVITTTPEPTQEAQEGEILVPTLEPIATQVNVNSDTQTEAETQEVAVLAPPTAEGNTAVEPVAPVQAQTTDSMIPLELASSAGNLVRIEGGTFQYGTDALEVTTAASECQNRDGGQCLPDYGLDSTPRVTVQLDTFWIEQNEVTFDQYVNFLNYQNSLGFTHRAGCQGFICIQTQNERPTASVIAFDGANYRIPANYSTLTDHPAYGVTWYGAQSYCQALGRRLPTEAEWEYAARAGGQEIIYPWGNDWNPSNANVRQPLISGEAVDSTVPITQFSTGTNTLGLSNMAGNVSEWVQDYYGETYYQDVLFAQQQSTGQPVLNPTGPAGGTTRVLRGGSFNSYPFFARTVHRQAQFPAPEIEEETYPLWVGFRCASDTGADTSAVPATTGDAATGDSAIPTIPATGADANAGAQPTADVPADAQSESDSGDASRG